MSSWGKRLQEIRLAKKMTQPELASLLGIDGTSLSRYETGRGAKQMPIKIKDSLLDLMTFEEIHYIDIGGEKPSGNISQSGSGNIQTIGNQNDINASDTKNFSEEDREIVHLLDYVPKLFKMKMIERMKEYKKQLEKEF